MCSDFPLGYHNSEAELKLAAFAARGYGATYVEKLGIRNPGLRHAGALVRRLAGSRVAGATPPFETCSPRLLVPRRAPVIDAFNRRWLARQLLAHVPEPARTIPWIRYPTPELVPFVERMDWPLVVYEVVDDHERSPGIGPRLGRVMRAAEDRLLARAGVVFAWSEVLAERLRARHGNVHVATAALDLAAFARARAEATPVDRVAVYAGSLDFRFDAGLVAAAARALSGWRFRLAGPADPPVAAALRDLPNVELLGRIPPQAVPPLLASATVCLMPYREDAFNDNLLPIKLVECLASGRPGVSTAIRAAHDLDGAVAVASGPEAFARAIERAQEDDGGAAATRLRRAETYGWDRRIDEMQAAIEAALA